MRTPLFVILILFTASVFTVPTAFSALLAPEGGGLAVGPASGFGELQSPSEESDKNLIAQASGGLSSARSGLSSAASGAGLKGIGSDDISIRAGQIIKSILGFIGVVFLVYTLIGGFMWMTAGGNSQRVSDGVSYIKNGVIGIVIILSAYAITNFVIALVA